MERRATNKLQVLLWQRGEDISTFLLSTQWRRHTDRCLCGSCTLIHSLSCIQYHNTHTHTNPLFHSLCLSCTFLICTHGFENKKLHLTVFNPHFKQLYMRVSRFKWLCSAVTAVCGHHDIWLHESGAGKDQKRIEISCYQTVLGSSRNVGHMLRSLDEASFWRVKRSAWRCGCEL